MKLYKDKVYWKKKCLYDYKPRPKVWHCEKIKYQGTRS